MLIQANDPRISWQGAVSLENVNGSVKPWRLEHRDLDLFHDPALLAIAELPSGVRMVFQSDAAALKVHFSHAVRSINSLRRDGTPCELPHCLLETFIDGKPFDLTDVADDGEFLHLVDLPPGNKKFEIHLPANSTFTLHSLELTDASVFHPVEDHRPRWIHYGSSISHCIRAETPSQIWPAIAARELGFNLTTLGLAGQCKLESSIAMMIRDLPADFISLKLGINTHLRDLSPRTFPPAVIGMVRIIREKHPETPLVLCSPIYSEPRENTPGESGQTLEQMRRDIAAVVEMFRKRGDRNIHYLDGLKLCGPEDADCMPDKLHPDAEGIKLMGCNFIREISSLNILENLK